MQRWERHNGLPVHRLLHNTSSSVYAYTGDLDQWVASRQPSAAATAEKSLRRAPTLVHRDSDGIDASAYQCYVRARHFASRRTAQSLLRAIQEFRKALDVDPTWALAHAAIAEAYVSLSGSELKPPVDGYPKARAAALQALALDPNLAQAHAVLGYVKAFFDADWRGAEIEFRAAIAAEPGGAVAHYYAGLAWMNQGAFDEAIAAIRRAVDLEPLSAAMTTNVGRPFLAAGDYNRALEWFHKGLELDPDLWFAHVFIGFAHEGKGQYEAARPWFEKAVSLAPESGNALACLAHNIAKLDERRRAKAMVREWSTRADFYVTPVRLARVCTATGHHDEAFAWLERACVDQSIRSNNYPQYDYAFEPLRSDPRFARVLCALNLSEPRD